MVSCQSKDKDCVCERKKERERERERAREVEVGNKKVWKGFERDCTATDNGQERERETGREREREKGRNLYHFVFMPKAGEQDTGYQ